MPKILQLLQLLQGANSEVEEALDDKDEAFEYVTALLDDTLEQADAAVDSAKRALQRGENPATSKVSNSYACYTRTYDNQVQARVMPQVCRLVYSALYITNSLLQGVCCELAFPPLCWSGF